MSKGTLCWKCNNTCGGCSWSKSFKPVDGWNAKKSNFYDNGKLVESYFVKECPKFEPLKIASIGVDDNKIGWFFKFSPYESAFTKEERALVGLYLKNTCGDIAKEIHKSKRTVFRRLNKIQQKLTKLEDEKDDANQYV